MSIARVAAGNALYWLVALAVAHYSLRRRRSHALPRDGEDSMGDDEVDNDALTKLAIWIFSDGAALCSIRTPVEPDEPSEEEMLDFVSRLHQHASGERDPTDRNALQKELCPFDGLYFFAEFPTNESCETDRVREHFHLLGERLGPRLFALAKSITNATRAEQPPSPLEKALRMLTERLGGGSSAHTTQARRALWTEVVLCTMQLFLPVLLITSENDTHGAGNAGFDLVSRHVARDVLAPILHQLDEIYEWVNGPSTSVTAEGQRQQPRSGGVLDWSHHSRRRSSLLQWRQRLEAVGRTVEGTIWQGVLLDKSPAGIEEFTARGLLCGVPFPAGEVCGARQPR